MALHPIKQKIFELWLEYDHALDDLEKGEAKVRRNTVIRSFLDSQGVPMTPDAFLHFLFPDYREWLVAEGHRKAKNRRF